MEGAVLLAPFMLLFVIYRLLFLSCRRENRRWEQYLKYERDREARWQKKKKPRN